MPAIVAVQHGHGPWWYDYATHQVVRYSDGRRWNADDVPELRRSLDERSTNPVVDVEKVDQWVLNQHERA